MVIYKYNIYIRGVEFVVCLFVVKCYQCDPLVYGRTHVRVNVLSISLIFLFIK